MSGGLVDPVPEPVAHPAVRLAERAVGAEYDPEIGIMRVTFTGDLMVEDLEEAVALVLAHPAFRMGMGVLWDLRGATVVGLSPGDLRRFRLFVLVRKNLRGGGKTAVAVAHVVDFGLVRMFELMCHDLPTKIAVFRAVETAEAWLLADREV
jgi:hypothetical protein